MSIQMKMLYCKKCGKQTLHYKNSNFWFHFIMFILTGFLWIIPFLIIKIFKKNNYYCSICTTKQ